MTQDIDAAKSDLINTVGNAIISQFFTGDLNNEFTFNSNVTPLGDLETCLNDDADIVSRFIDKVYNSSLFNVSIKNAGYIENSETLARTYMFVVEFIVNEDDLKYAYIIESSVDGYVKILFKPDHTEPSWLAFTEEDVK
jgi:D-mannonate dehydratase